MSHPRLAALCVLGLAAVFPALPCAADTLVFLRGDALYRVDSDGTEAPRRLFAIGKAADTMWSLSPDGRRVAWVTRSVPSNADPAALTPGLTARPAVASVSDLSGRHEKRLFTTADLRNRQGHKVTALNPGNDPAATPAAPEDGVDGATSFNDWQPVSVAWSADSRTLYLSCVSQAAQGGKATFATDAASGFALVDGEERWRSLAAATHLAARDGILAGSGLARFTVSSESDTPQRYAPVVVVDLAGGTRSPLFAAAADSGKNLPDYAFATDCALSPDTRTVAFVGASKGLWIVDRKMRTYRRLLEGAVRCPRWSADGKRLLFLLSRPVVNTTTPGSETLPPLDLYEIVLPSDATSAGADTPTPPLRLVLQDVDGFDVAPE